MTDLLIAFCVFNIVGIFIESTVPVRFVKFTSVFTVLMIAALTVFALLMLCLSLNLLRLHKYLNAGFSFILACLPFVIGKFASYKKKYLYISLTVFSFVLAILFLVFNK